MLSPITLEFCLTNLAVLLTHECEIQIGSSEWRSRVGRYSTKRTKMTRNVRRTCWNKYANELDHRLHDLNSTPVSISSVDD